MCRCGVRIGDNIMKILVFAACLGLLAGLTACQNQEAQNPEERVEPKTFAGEAVERAKGVSKAADEHNRMLAEQAGE